MLNNQPKTMEFRQIKLQTNNLNSVQDFYQNIFELPIIGQSDQMIAFKIGKTDFIFELSQIPNPVYHYAINIPENQFEAACDWLRKRVKTIEYENSDVVDFKNWNAHSIYFYDSVGNIGELIARHDLDNATDEIFTTKSLLAISEIGLPTKNVAVFKALLNQYFGINTYVSGSETFEPLGDENGLFICVALDRKWFPTEIISKAFPIEIVLDFDKKVDFEYEVYRFLSLN
jgi:catechol-2,3-dioxygenase